MKVSINNITELQKIGNDPNYPLDGQYELTQDIDGIETKDWNDGKGFAPIGNKDDPFIGKFDGKGYKITNLYINRPLNNYIGLFGYIGEGGEVCNLGLENVWVSGYWYVGGIVGVNEGIVSNCYSTCRVTGESRVGGLVGRNSGSVLHCYSTGSVSSSILGMTTIGGLIGVDEGTVR